MIFTCQTRITIDLFLIANLLSNIHWRNQQIALILPIYSVHLYLLVSIPSISQFPLVLEIILLFQDTNPPINLESLEVSAIELFDF